MSDTSDLVRVKNIDLNCILFFVFYMKYRKVSIVSNLIGCSDATVSINLRRFTHFFPKVVFERKSRVLVPTDFAFALNEKCIQVINMSYDVFFGSGTVSIHDAILAYE